MNRRSHLKTSLSAAAVLAFGLAFSSAVLAADPPPAHVRGTIVSATADTLVVKTAGGQTRLTFGADAKIAGIVPSSLDQIKSGTFVGIANVPGSGTSSALEVVVFPDAMKGSGLGDYAWDLAPGAGMAAQSSAMTNGTVKAARAPGGVATTSAMTNGTVKSTSTAKGLVLTVDYGKGEKTIEVPAGVPVVTIVPADAKKLVPGAHVFVATQKDAPTQAAFIAVGIDGTVPPM